MTKELIAFAAFTALGAAVACLAVAIHTLLKLDNMESEINLIYGEISKNRRMIYEHEHRARFITADDLDFVPNDDDDVEIMEFHKA